MLHRSARYNIIVKVSQFEDRNHVGFFSSFKFLTFSKRRVLNRLSVIARVQPVLISNLLFLRAVT